MNPLADALSSALLHFLWQGLAVSALLWAALWIMRGCSANARYVISCAALAVQAALPVLTMLLLYTTPPLRQASSGVLVPARIGLIIPATSIDWQRWALPLWFTGVLIFSVRLGWGYLQIAALRRRGKAADMTLRSTVYGLAERMGLSRSIEILTAAAADGPSVIGWIRPVILIPAATIAGLSADQLEMVLAHELAHIRRFDYLVNLGQMMIETLLFYHPAVWWVSAQIRRERELCCDDIAVRVCGNPIAYARALTALEKLRSEAPSLALGAASKPLLYRVQRLTAMKTRDDSSGWAGILAVSAALTCLAFNANWARGQAPVPSPRPPTPETRIAKKAPATPKKRLIRIQNPWLAQQIVQSPNPPKTDPLPPDLSHALDSAEYTFGWELGSLYYRSDNQSLAVSDALEKLNPRGTEINRDVTRLRKEAAGTSSAEAREKVVTALRALVDELNKINEQLREARHEAGETRDPPMRTN